MDLTVTSAGAAVLAGVVSFLSPCVLPLVPPYLCFVSGQSLEEMQGQGAPSDNRILAGALAFVLGFSTVFILLGASASTVGALLHHYVPLLSKIAGVFIILMGLNFFGVFKLGFLMRDTRYQQQNKPRSFLGAYAVGAAFALGWTPCIGPILAAILSVAASSESLGRGMVLLALYSVGLGLPFLAAAFGMGRFLQFFHSFRKHLRHVERVMGLALVVTGLLFVTDSLQVINSVLLKLLPGLASIG